LLEEVVVEQEESGETKKTFLGHVETAEARVARSQP